MRCGLLGAKLGHSYSPRIHSYLGDYEYLLYEKKEDELEAFLKSGIDGLNVTIPYKRTVMPYLDEISDRAKKIGSVNTVVRRKDGALFGDNTDIYGFEYLLKRANIDVLGKKAIVLGSGGTSLTASFALKELGASGVTVISRKGEDNYENIARHFDAQIIVNTTPVGMYPNNGEAAVDLTFFKEAEGVVDVIYNPSDTALILQAKRLKIPCTGGLPMLVAQAKRASELFTGKKIDDGEIEHITHILEADMKNIVLIGMPGCGKSAVGKRLAEKLGRELIDTDAVIIENAGMSIPDIFEKEGEEGFRKRETEALRQVCRESAKIIATGGGCITREENRDILRQNGTLIWLKRDLKLLSKKGRPLSQKTNAEDMYKVRRPLYESFCDFSIDNNGNFIKTVDEIIRRIK